MTGGEYESLRKSSESRARSELFEEYCGYVYAVVYNRLRSAASHEDIEECVSDVFADVFLKLDSGSVKGELKPFISTVAKRRAIDAYRAARRRSRALSLFAIDEDEPAGGVLPEENAERAELSKTLMETIKALGEPDSVIIIKRYYYNESSKQIARELSLKPSTVRTRCRRALIKLRESLKAAGFTM